MQTCNFPSFSECSWCLSDFTDKKPFCLSTANLAQAAASENWLVSMPLLRYLWAAMKRPKDGANFSWQLNAAPDGCSSQCWNYSPDRAANKPISPPCSTTKEVIFLLATSYAVRKAGYRADGKQTTLATCTAPLPLLQQLQQISAPRKAF